MDTGPSLPSPEKGITDNIPFSGEQYKLIPSFPVEPRDIPHRETFETISEELPITAMTGCPGSLERLSGESLIKGGNESPPFCWVNNSLTSGTLILPVSPPLKGKIDSPFSAGWKDPFLPTENGGTKSSDFDPCITANVPCTITDENIKSHPCVDNCAPDNIVYGIEKEQESQILEGTQKDNKNSLPNLREIDGKISNIGKIYGSNFLSTNEQCGTIYRKVFCNTDRTHKPASLHIHCNDPLCPICYKKFAGRIAERVSERVMGYKSVYPGRKKLFSLIFWPKFGTVYENLDAAFDDGKRMLADMGVTGAVVWVHPYRIKKEIQPKLRRIQRQIRIMNEANPEGKQRRTKGFWEMAHEDALCIGGLENYIVPGVHFHAQATGYLEDAKEYSERTGAGYKKKGYLDNEDTVSEIHKNIQKNAYYFSTHSSYEPGKDTVRYFGLMSRYNLRRTQTGEYFDNVKCDICDSTLSDYDYNAETKVLSVMPVHSVITRKIRVYRYWIRGIRPPEKPSQEFLSKAAHEKKLREMLDKARAIQNQKLKGWD